VVPHGIILIDGEERRRLASRSCGVAGETKVLVKVAQIAGETPDLPAVAVFGTLALASALVAQVAAVTGKRRVDAAWAFLPLALAGVAFLLGGRSTNLHMVASVSTAAALARNAMAFRGVSRWSSVVACLAWLASMVSARVLFG